MKETMKGYTLVGIKKPSTLLPFSVMSWKFPSDWEDAWHDLWYISRSPRVWEGEVVTQMGARPIAKEHVI